MNTRKKFLISALFITATFFFTIPALAIPVAGDYTLNSTVFNGTFTSNGSELTQWEFVTNPQGVIFGSPSTPAAPHFNNESIFFVNNGLLGLDFRSLFIRWNPQIIPREIIVEINTDQFTTNIDRNPNITITAPATVPEPASMLLFGSGLFGLAGYRWSQRRREGTQLG